MSLVTRLRPRRIVPWSLAHSASAVRHPAHDDPYPVMRRHEPVRLRLAAIEAVRGAGP